MLAKFFRTLRSSLYDPAFYSQVPEKELSSGIKVFSVLAGVGILISLLVVCLDIIPFAFGDFPTKLENAFPADLVVTVVDGNLSINQPEPYYVKNTLEEATSSLENLVIFDTGDQLPGSHTENNTFVLVKKTYAISGSESQNGRVASFSDLHGTSTLDKAMVVSFIEKYRPFFAPVVLFGSAALIVMGTFFITLGWLLFHLLYLVIPAVLIRLFSLVHKPRLTFKGAYMVALYASIPVTILSWLVSLTEWSLPHYSYTLLLLLVAVANLTRRSSQQKGSEEPITNESL
jgi:hypothetical protein